ncbi:hypothetical protein [Candidatus Leptofilum sp.]|uniref:hypothetical protein n=1 Tax=Candidatus Leptofilum sp. TaxID=3241576 RepID=UPI003B5CA653
MCLFEQIPIPILCVTMVELQAITETQNQPPLTTVQIEQVVNRLRKTLQSNCLWQEQIKKCIEEVVIENSYERWLQEVGNSLWEKANLSVAEVNVPIADLYALFINGTAPEQAATAVLMEACYEQS